MGAKASKRNADIEEHTELAAEVTLTPPPGISPLEMVQKSAGDDEPMHVPCNAAMQVLGDRAAPMQVPHNPEMPMHIASKMACSEGTEADSFSSASTWSGANSSAFSSFDSTAAASFNYHPWFPMGAPGAGYPQLGPGMQMPPYCAGQELGLGPTLWNYGQVETAKDVLHAQAEQLEAYAAQLRVRAASAEDASLCDPKQQHQQQLTEAAATMALGGAAQPHASVGTGLPTGLTGAECWLGSYGNGMPWAPPPGAMMQGMPLNSRGVTVKPNGRGTIGGDGMVRKLREDEFTTVMLRNLPNDYTREMLLDLLDTSGFYCLYDFVYLPIDFKRKAGLGYAFVNMVTHEDALRIKEKLDGFGSWVVSSQKVCEVAWGDPLQGLEDHIERYRNSPVMHEDVPDVYRPVLFQGGCRVEFPKSTRKIRPPRVKCRPESGGDLASAAEESLS